MDHGECVAMEELVKTAILARVAIVTAIVLPWMILVVLAISWATSHITIH